MTASRVVRIALGAVVGSIVPVHAALLGVAPGAPVLLFDAQGVTTYDSVTDLFVVAASPVAIRFTPFGLPVLVLPTGDHASEAVSIQIYVDETGAFSGGVAEADLVVIGQVDQDGDSLPEFSGVLLTGEAVAFGFQEKSRSTGVFDFRFAVTGGAMATEFGGGAIGVTLVSESSKFSGGFTRSFGGYAKGVIGPIAFRCGDNFVDPGEQCDDGNTSDDDACTDSCTIAVCGDGIVRTGLEQCDDGNTNDNDVCSNDCTTGCGNGIVNTGEQCDDGNQINHDSCSNACTLPVCGDGIVQFSETCDDGNVINTDCCTNACKLPRCGDGFISACLGSIEGCDDGNDVNDDLCTNVCTPGTPCDDHDPCTEDLCVCDLREDDESVATGDHHDPGGRIQNCICPSTPCDDDGDDQGGSVAKGLGDDDDEGDGQTCKCIHRPICTGDCCPNCDDGNPCTEDSCGPGSRDGGVATGTGNHDDDGDGTACACRHRWISACCLTDAGCNDKDDCTSDRCVNHHCVRTPVVPCCGDESVDAPETCDPPGSKQDNGNVCRSNCTYCGDGIKNGYEECDGLDIDKCSTVAKNDEDGCTDDCKCAEDDEGCSPGYWKNHTWNWNGVGGDATSTIKTTTLFNAIFGVGGSASGVANCMTLLAALNLPNTTHSCGTVGSPRNEKLALDRHAAAALANADSGISYPYTLAEVIALYRDAVGADPGPETISSAKSKLSAANELRCPY